MARRPRHIVKRGRIYYLRISVDGKEVWRSLRTDNLQEAIRQVPFQQSQLLELEPPRTSKTTFRSFCDEWQADYVPQECSEARAYNIRTWMKKHVLPTLGDRRISSVDVRDLRRLRASLEAKGLATGTVASILSIVRAMLSYAVLVEEIPRNPFQGSRVMPAEDDLTPRRLSDEDVESILKVCLDKHRLSLLLALRAGLRWGEVMRLNWSNVVWKPNSHLRLEGTKGRRKARRRRKVPLDPEIAEVLREARSRATGDIVIENRPWNSWVIRRQIKKETGISFRFHDLRHTFAARYVEAGGSLAMLQEILGHRSLKMVMRYALPTEEAVRVDAERVWRNRSRNSSRNSRTAEVTTSP